MKNPLVGSDDLGKSVKTGKTVFFLDILPKAHYGVLYIDDMNLLDEKTVNILSSVATKRYIIVKHEGLSIRYPCRPLLIATFKSEKAELRDHLLDRISIALSADAVKLSLIEQVQVVLNVLNFFSNGMQGNKDAKNALKKTIENKDDLKTTIVFACECLKDLKVTPSQIQYLCEEAICAGC